MTSGSDEKGLPAVMPRSVVEGSPKRMLARALLALSGKVPLPRRTLRYAARYTLGAEVEWIGKGFVVVYRAGTADEWVLQHSFDNDIFFTSMPDYEPSPADQILDVGAHIGDFSLLAASKVPKGRVFAVEASRETFRLLQANVALNGARNIVPLHLALAGSSGEARLFLFEGPHNWAHSTSYDHGHGSETVAAKSLEQLFSEHDITVIDLAKFNCEGAEFEILLNAPCSVLQKMKRMLVLYHCDLASGYSLEELIRYLRHSGFGTQLVNVRDDGNNGWIVARQTTQ